MFALIVFTVGINLGFNSPQKAQLDTAIWSDVVFRTNQYNQLLKLHNEKNNISNVTFNKPENNYTSINLLDYFRTPNSPGDFYYDFENPPADSGEKKPEEETEILLDPTNYLNDSTLVSDSTNKGVDSMLVKEDSIKVDWRLADSTARLEQFRFQREDKSYVELRRKKQSKFFIEPTSSYKTRTVRIDSTGQFVEIIEKIGTTEPKIMLRMPIDEYINMKLALNEREEWEKLCYAYELGGGAESLSELITSFTDFEIPLPSVGVLSIFGEPKISLKIGGAVQIHGAWRSETTEGVTASRLGNTRNEPDFKQQVQINVSGTIGDKLNISADWNTERTFEYENQLKITYTGYEDEIIQKIEAGNVSMQTSPLVGGAEALFGVKAQFKMGPLRLTTIASQKKGETKEVSVSGGSTSQDYSIRAYNYSDNHYFIDEVYADTTASLNLFENYYNNNPPQVDDNFKVTEIEVWKSTTQILSDQSKVRNANCYINLPPLQSFPGGVYPDSLSDPQTFVPISGIKETGRFLLLTPDTDYELHPSTGFITMKTSVNETEIIAVSFKQGTTVGSTYGQFLNTVNQEDSVIVLKLVKPKNLQPQYEEAWSLKLKNIYPTGARNIERDGFEFNIKYEVVGQDPTDELQTPQGNVRLLQAFGLDKVNSSGQPIPDNKFDYIPGITIFPETGEVIFPVLQPFGNNINPSLQNYDYPQIYDTTKTYAQQYKAEDKWALGGKNTGTSSANYQLGFNVVENSVRVVLNGRELKEGTDYVVDYNIGQLSIRNDAALVPGADLKITYEQNDLFQLASKTLLGARGIYDFSDKTQLGFTIMNLNQETLSDKVRIGEEPLSNTIMGLDFKTLADLPFLTNSLDYLISTKEMSTFSLTGEYAYMIPDPNTKKSTIPSDSGKSIAYVDDFEGAKRLIPIPINYTGWKDLSVPEQLNGIAGLPTRQDRMGYKGKSFWYTVTPSDVFVDSIYGGRKDVARSENEVAVLDYVFLPDTPGTYNGFPTLEQKQLNWGGMQRILSSTANNLIEQNIEFIEFWMKIDPLTPPDAVLNIDLGVISEDVIPNNELDTEDKNNNQAIDIEDGEDTGIDGRFDDAERTFYGSSKGDPAVDNFIFEGNPISIFDYFNINGTQGNAISTDAGLLPDTEDLNTNGTVDLANNYFRYSMPLSTDSTINPFVIDGGFPTANGKTSWYLYRIPLRDTSSVIGNPSFSDVETIRMYIQGVQSAVHFRITEFNLVGNQWQKVDTEDTVLSVSTVSYEESDDYTSPPGVFRERDRTNPDEEIYNNEQSLNLIYTGLPDGQSRSAQRYLFRPLDLFNYSQMKLFVHGDANYDSLGSISYVDDQTGQYSSEVFIRFGTDADNYYEYRQPVIYNRELGSGGWSSIAINFSEITALKASPKDSAGFVIQPVPGLPGHFYIVKGNPTLTSVKVISIGVYNVDDGFNSGELSGEVWVNELRVIDANDTNGWAYSLSTSIKLADLMTVNYNISYTNPYFHRLPERFGTRIENQNWTLSTDLDVLKLIPFNMQGSNLRLSYSHSESLGKPLYIPGTDISLEQAEKQLLETPPDLRTQTPEQLVVSTQTMNVSNTISSSNIKLKLPTDVWYIRDTWNALSYGFNYNNRFSRSPTILNSTSWLWSASINYGFNFSPDLFFKFADIPLIGALFELFGDYKDVKFYFAPQNFAATATANRNQNSSQTRSTTNIPTTPIVSQDFTTSRGFNFNWKITEGGLFNLSSNYNLTINSSLAYLLTNPDGSERSEDQIWNDIFGGAGFGQDNRYQQTIDIRTQPRLPSLWDINRYFTLTAGYSVGYSWDYDLRNEITGRSAGANNKFTTGLILRWKSLTEPLFKSDSENETTRKTINDSTIVDGSVKPSSLTRAFQFFVTAIKFVFFDWENFTINYAHDFSYRKSGIEATGTGFYNFWGLTQDYANGPGRAFQLGFNSNDIGPRAQSLGSTFSDAYAEKNNIDFKTARPLWEGAKIDITWNVSWSENKNVSLTTDAFGNVTITNTTATGSNNKSFLSLPSSFPFVESGIDKVHSLYNPNAENPRESLTNAFVEGLESIPFLSGLPVFEGIQQYIPRPNWRFTWDGLEKFLFFKSLAQRLSLDHAYTSTYVEGWKLTTDGTEEVQNQRIEYGFTPFAGLNITFGELWGGNLSGSIKFSSRTSYDLGVSTTNITETSSNDIGFTASYSKSGFEFPLFGISLKNDVEFLISYTNTSNEIIRYEMNNYTEEGIPQDGTTRTSLEPRIKYTISSKVSLSIFYKRSTVEPKGAARIPPTTTNEAGIDVNIVIQ